MTRIREDYLRGFDKILRGTITKTMNTNYTLNWISCVEKSDYYIKGNYKKGRFSSSLLNKLYDEWGWTGLEFPFNSF